MTHLLLIIEARDLIHFFHCWLPANNIFISACKLFNYTYFVHQWGWHLEWICNFIPMLMWKSGIHFVEFLLVLDHYSTLELFCVIYILAGFNHFWMVTNCLIYGLGWRFWDISVLVIILCEPFLSLIYLYLGLMSDYSQSSRNLLSVPDRHRFMVRYINLLTWWVYWKHL